MRNDLLIIVVVCAALISACDTDGDPHVDPPIDPQPNIENTFGFGILDRINGIWNGPVSSTTALGGYPEWIVDIRPISESQVSAKNELDSQNDIFLSFFIVKHDNAYKVAFRNGGSFAGQKRVSYFMADSVDETPDAAYYRFAEAVKGTDRAYTTVEFRSDSLIMRSYTNRYNTQQTASLHMEWRARLQDTTSCQPTISHFAFPKKMLTMDMSGSFTGAEAVYFSLTDDPFPDGVQPYLGTADVSYSFAGGFVPDPAKKVYLIITTQPLINGFSLNLPNLKYRSRYVRLGSTAGSFSFTLMHPGQYYLYALYDADGNDNFSSGDRVSTVNTTFTVPETGSVSATASLNFTLP
jgi:hypothetical protein